MCTKFSGVCEGGSSTVVSTDCPTPRENTVGLCKVNLRVCFRVHGFIFLK